MTGRGSAGPSKYPIAYSGIPLYIHRLRHRSCLWSYLRLSTAALFPIDRYSLL